MLNRISLRLLVELVVLGVLMFIMGEGNARSYLRTHPAPRMVPHVQPSLGGLLWPAPVVAEAASVRTPSTACAPFTPGFTNMVNVFIQGGSIQKSAGTASTWDAGAIGTLAIQGGDGWIQATVDVTGTTRGFGLSSGDHDQTQLDIDFAALLNGTNVQGDEDGNTRGNLHSIVPNDVVTVSVESGVVYTYWGSAGTARTRVYTSTGTPQFPLLLDTAINSSGGWVPSLVMCVDTSEPSVAPNGQARLPLAVNASLASIAGSVPVTGTVNIAGTLPVTATLSGVIESKATPVLPTLDVTSAGETLGILILFGVLLPFIKPTWRVVLAVLIVPSVAIYLITHDVAVYIVFAGLVAGLPLLGWLADLRSGGAG